MSSKEDILKKYRANIHERFDMPDLSDIQAITYSDPLLQFMNMTKSVGMSSSASCTLMPRRLPRTCQRLLSLHAIPTKWVVHATSTAQTLALSAVSLA